MQRAISEEPRWVSFKPLVVESTGGWHPFSFKYLKDIADRMAGMSRLSAVDALSKLYLRLLSVCKDIKVPSWPDDAWEYFKS